MARKVTRETSVEGFLRKVGIVEKTLQRSVLLM